MKINQDYRCSQATRASRGLTEIMMKHNNRGLSPVTIHHAYNRFEDKYFARYREDFQFAHANGSMREYDQRRLRGLDLYLLLNNI